MGYYSTLEFEIKEAVIDINKKEEIEKQFSDINNENIYGFWGVSLPIDCDGKLLDIELEEYYAKFYDDELFVDELKNALITGEIYLYFAGEDGTQWGYRVEPENVTPLCTVWVPCE